MLRMVILSVFELNVIMANGMAPFQRSQSVHSILGVKVIIKLFFSPTLILQQDKLDRYPMESFYWVA
jgi:hypothetical protein